MIALALVMGVGSSWDTVQMVSWTRQFIVATRAMPVVSAMRVTFAPGNFCSRESADRDERRARSASDPMEVAAEARKPTLAPALSGQVAAPTPPATRAAYSRPDDFSPPAATIREVPVPPPRAAV